MLKKWISVEGNYGSGKTSLLKYIKHERANLHTALPDSVNFHDHSDGLEKQLYDMKKFIFFQEKLPMLKHTPCPIGHSGLVFTDSAASCLYSLDSQLCFALGRASIKKPDFLIFLRLPSVEENWKRCLNSRYSLLDFATYRQKLRRIKSDFPENSVINIDVGIDDTPEVVYSKVMSVLKLLVDLPVEDTNNNDSSLFLTTKVLQKYP